MITSTMSQYDSELHNFNPGNLFPISEDYLWLVKTGVVKTYTWNEAGTETTIGYWGDGDVVGQPLSAISPYAMKCLTKVTATQINLQESDLLYECICNHIQQSEELLYIVRSDRVYDKLKRLFKWLANKFGQEVQQGRLINFPLTHQELAEAISITRVSVTKLINQLEQEEFIIRHGRNYIVVSSEDIAAKT
ncbi:MAG: Crp/Fnr family transcriptional regulator [Xenococcaceae cyanobacterium MO_167.B52]|nr:Crp/Fnr family transcriptional regulator [Xenococcaceae cyanobacterium MO_167.B52]